MYLACTNNLLQLTPKIIFRVTSPTEFRVALPWELYADDLIVIAETEDDLIKRLNEWKDNVENRGMRVNMNTRSPAEC